MLKTIKEKMKQPLSRAFLAATLVGAPMALGGCAAGSGIVAGAGTAAILKDAGVDEGTANLVGVGVGLITAETVGEHLESEKSQRGQCEEQYVLTRDSYGNERWVENVNCTRTTTGYPGQGQRRYP